MLSVVIILVGCSMSLASAQVARNGVYRDRTNLRPNLQSNLQQTDRLRQSDFQGTLQSDLPQTDRLRQTDLQGTLGSGLLQDGMDLLTYDIKTQPSCREIKRGPVGSQECGWNAGLSRNVDQYYLNGRIAAYKIQWEHGSWSEWYVPGVNDIDIKFNTQSSYCQDYEVRPNSMRRWWAYFNEYTHIIILCENQTKQKLTGAVII